MASKIASNPDVCRFQLSTIHCRLFTHRKINGTWRIVHHQVSVPVDLATGKAALDLTP